MNEEKVRQAVQVTNELVDWQKMPEYSFMQIWRDVFAALVSEPYPDYRTATAAELVGDEKQK